MAEVTALRNNALPYPVYGCPFGIKFSILDVNADYVSGAAALDSEVSKNGDNFADCTNEATEIGTSGIYYLLLTAAEMTADVVAVKVKTTTTGAKNPALTFYPRKLVPSRTGTAAGGATGYVTLDSGASAIDDFYNGCLAVVTIDSVIEARIITDYTGSTKQAAVTPAWNTAPDSDDPFTVYILEGMQIYQSNLVLINSLSRGVVGLERACSAITYGTCDTGCTQTAIEVASILPAMTEPDQFKGLILAFDKDTTTAELRGQKTDITANDDTGTITVTALTTSPASGDTFTIE